MFHIQRVEAGRGILGGIRVTAFISADFKIEPGLVWGRGDLSFSQNTFVNNCKQTSDLLSLL